MADQVQAARTQAARTPGAKRAGPGEHVFDLAKVNHIKGGPDYSSVEGACVEGDRMIVALMRMPAGTGAVAHSHPNEQWIYVLEGTMQAKIGEQEIEAPPGSVVYVPSNAVHSAQATEQGDVVFFTVKDAQPARHQGVGIFVMPSLVPGNHDFLTCHGKSKDVDGRDKPGHDGTENGGK